MDKYIWKNRLLLIKTYDYKNDWYKNVKNEYQKNIKNFHKRYIKLIVDKKTSNKNSIKLIGFDGRLKKTYTNLDVENILQLVDKMPLAKYLKSNPALKPVNLSLYSDYNKKTTISGLGFKNKEKALHTLNVIKNKNIKYQKNVVNTMIGRAKHHPHKTKEMKDAIKIFTNWIKLN